MQATGNLSVPARRRVLAAWIVLLGFCLYFPSAPVRAEDRPIIQVSFQFEGALAQRIPADKRAAIAAKVENTVSRLAENRWGFLHWTNSLPPPASAAKWTLTLEIQTRQITNHAGGTSTGSIATLRHAGQLGSDKVLFEQTEGKETIYPLGRLIPFHDPVALVDDIETQLDEQLGSLFESLPVKTFLKSIPIVERVIVDASNSRLVVPLKISDLRSDVDSMLRVSFVDANNRPSRLDLETAAQVPEEGNHKGYVVGWVKEQRLFTAVISTPTWWDPQLISVIDTARDVKVYMISYSPSLTGSMVTDEGVVSEPDS